MSNIHPIFPPDHEVFRGGRYLEAFSCLEDIDHYELAILQYLGNKMPFDKGFVGQVAFPSVATISMNTKIPESTVRKKIKGLVKKGYIIKKERRMLNERGHWQQSSNDYILTNLAFEKFGDVLVTKRMILSERKRAVGQSEVSYPVPIPQDSPPPKDSDVGSYQCDSDPMQGVETNSPSMSPKECPNESPDSSSKDHFARKKSEVDRLVVVWEEVVKKAVSGFEKRRFLQDYIRTRSNEISILDKMQRIEQDPYLHSRAKSLNWLFQGFDIAEKNRAEIARIGHREIKSCQSMDELRNVEKQLPELIERKSHNFVSARDELVSHLFGESLTQARQRLGCRDDSCQPRNTQELLKALEVDLDRELSSKQRARLESIRSLVPSTSFAELLKLYVKHRG